MTGITSLSKQLRTLKRNYQDTEDGTIKRYSLVYNSQEVKTISAETAFKDSLYAIGEMIQINKNFEKFENILFSKHSIYLSRVNMSESENEHLNRHIFQFLALLSPYIMLVPAQMSLEWLIFKYEINIHNEETFFLSLLPFYSTKIFRRAMLLIPCDNFRTPLHGLIKILTERTLVFDDLLNVSEVSKWLIYRYFKFCNTVQDLYFIREDTHTMIFSFLSSFMLNSLAHYNPSFDKAIDKIIPLILHGIGSDFKHYFFSCLCVFNKIIQLFILNPTHVTNYIYGILKSEHSNSELIFKLLPYVIDKQNIHQLDKDNIRAFFEMVDFWELEEKNINFNNLPSSFFITIFDSFLVHLNTLSDDCGNSFWKIFDIFIFFVSVASKINNLSGNFILSLKAANHLNSEIVEEILMVLLKSDKSAIKQVISDEKFSHILKKCEFVDEISFDSISDNFTNESFSEISESLLNGIEKYINGSTPEISKLVCLGQKLEITNPELLKKLKWDLAILLSKNYQKWSNFIRETDLAFVFSEPLYLIPVLSKILPFESENDVDCPLILRLLSIKRNLNEKFGHSLKHIISFKNSPEMFFAIDFSEDLYFLINTIPDLEKSKSYAPLMHILLIINVNIINKTDYLPYFIAKLFDLLTVHKKIKPTNHITSSQTAEEVFSLLASTEPNVHLTVSCIIWSLNNVVQYLDYSNCIKDYNTDFFDHLVSISYSTDYEKSIYSGIRNVLCKLLDKIVVGKNLKNILTFTFEKGTDLPQNHSPVHFISFLVLLNDLIKSRVSLTYVWDDIIVSILQLLNHENSRVRSLSIDILRSIKVLRLFPGIIDAILKCSTLISDDQQYIKVCISRICRQASSVSDKIMDLLINYLKNTSITKSSLFSFECLSTAAHPELPSMVASYIIKIMSLASPEKLHSAFLEYFIKYILSTIRINSKNEEIFQAINNWSISEIHSSLIMQKMSEIFLNITPDKRTKLLNNWIFYMANYGSKRKILDSIISLPIDANDLIKLYNSVFVTVLEIQASESILPLENGNRRLLNPENILPILLEITSSENKFGHQSRLLGFLLEISGQLFVFKDASLIHERFGIEQSVLIEKLLKSINCVLCNLLNSGTKINVQESVNFKHIVNILRHQQKEKIVNKCLTILMHASKLCPELLLDYLMPLFTFMASYSVKKDDNTSLNVISRVIEVVIPQICESFSTDTKKEILPIIQSFCGSFIHMPKHRHGPLFVTLVNTLPFKNSLGIVISYIMEINSADSDLYEFISEIITDVQIEHIAQSFKYLLKKCQTKGEVIDQQNTEISVELKEKIEITSNLITYIIESNTFNRKIVPLKIESKKIVADTFLKSLTLSVNILNDLSKYSLNQAAIEKLILVMGGLCHQIKFLRAIYQGITEGSISTYINILNSWASTPQDCHKYKNVFKNIVISLAEFVNSSDKTNKQHVNVSKKCISIVKNFIRKTDSYKVKLIVFEKLLNLRFYVQESVSLSLSLGWAISESFQHIPSDVSKSLPTILEFLCQMQLFTKVNSSSQFNEMIVGCLVAIIGTNGSFPEIYLLDVFGIILNMPCELYFKDLSAYKSILFKKHPEYSSLTLVKHITNNISYELVLFRLHEFIVGLTDMSKKGVMFIILLLFMNIIRADRLCLSKDKHQNLYTEIFDNLLSYRCICHKDTNEFLPYYERLIISASYEYFLKQKEDSLFKSLSLFLERSLANFDSVYLYLRLVSVYQLLAFLTKKIGNTMIPFMRCAMETICKHLVNILDDFESKKIDLFLSICKCIKYTLLHDISNEISSNTLSIIAKCLSESFSYFSIRDNKLVKLLKKQVVPAIAYICVRLQSHNKLNNFIIDLSKMLSESDNQKYGTLLAFEQICRILPNQAQLVLHTILYNLEEFKSYKNTKISVQAKTLHDSLVQLSTAN